MSRPKVIECGACGHADYHCPASGCNGAECECESFVRITQLELGTLEAIAHVGGYVIHVSGSVNHIRALHRLVRKGCIDRLTTDGLPHAVTPSGRAVLLGCPPDILHDLLGLVEERPPTIAALTKLTRDDREYLREWAAREHLSASDNIVRRRPRPQWLDALPKTDAEGAPS